MGIFSTPYEGVKWLGSKSLEYSKKALYSPIAVGGWFRTTVSELLTQRTDAPSGAIGDKVSVYPASYVAGRLAGTDHISAAEGAVLGKQRIEVRKKLWKNADDANRIWTGDDKEAINYERIMHGRYSGDVDREININTPQPSVTDRMAMRRLGELINSTRPAGNQLTLLSSAHPISIINQKRSQLYAQKGPLENPTPLNMLRYPPLTHGKKEKPGNVSYTRGWEEDSFWSIFKKKKPRFDASKSERFRSLSAPVISTADKTKYTVNLAEKAEDYANRIKTSFAGRKALKSFPISVQVSLGDPEYPTDGNPFRLYEKLYSEYKDQLKDPNWKQLSLSMVRKGKTVTLTGFLTKNRPNVPETMHEPPLPPNFNDDWWYEKAEQSIDQAAPNWAYRNEATLLSCYSQNPDKISTQTHELKAEEFTEERHQIIFQALKDLHESNKPITAGSLSGRIIEMGKMAEAGGMPYIVHICFRTTPPADFNPRIAIMVIKRKKSTRLLYERNFHSGISVLAFTNLDLLVQELHDEGYDVSIPEDPTVMPDQDLNTLRSDTLNIKLNINGQSEVLTLVRGTDLFKLGDKSLLAASSEGEGDEAQAFLNIEELSAKLKQLKEQRMINRRPIPLRKAA